MRKQTPQRKKQNKEKKKAFSAAGSRSTQAYKQSLKSVTEAMPPKLAQVALDVQFLYQPLQIILSNFSGLVQLFEDLQQRRQLTQFVSQALPIIVRICTDICGTTYHAPRLTNAARALVQDMETQLGLAPGDGVSRIAEGLLGSPPISLLLEEFRCQGQSSAFLGKATAHTLR